MKLSNIIFVIFICGVHGASSEKDKSITNWGLADITQTIQQCESGWYEYADSCYHYSWTSAQFIKAFSDCEKLNATLFVANSEKEWNYILMEFPESEEWNKTNSATTFWIGLRRKNAGSKYIWQVESQFDPVLLNWKENRYERGVTNRCAFFRQASKTSYPISTPHVGHKDCQGIKDSTNYHYICERNITIMGK